MPVTDAETLQKELSKFEGERRMIRPENEELIAVFIEERNEAFIKALTERLQKKLLDHYRADSDERLNRLKDIRQMFSTTPFTIGAEVFRVSTDEVTTEQVNEVNGEAIKAWVDALQKNLLARYREAPEKQRLQRLGEISFMFRSSAFQVGQRRIRVAAAGVDAETNIADFPGTYGCPVDTVCIDGNCV